MTKPEITLSPEAMRAEIAGGAAAFYVPVDVLEIAGSDAASYLHGQLSQNVEGLQVGDSAFSLLLAPQGFVEAWFRVLRRDDNAFWLVVEAGYGEAAAERLNRFKLRVDCTIASLSMILSAFRGPKTSELTRAIESRLGDDTSFSRIDARWPSPASVESSETETGEVDIVGPTGLVLDEVGVGDDSGFEWLRVASGQPAMGSEISEKTIPAAVGVVDMSVDFTKGCYVGQELVARVDSRGNNTPTRLYRVELGPGAESVSAGDQLRSSAGDAGTLTSIVHLDSTSVGLALLKRSADLSSLWLEGHDNKVSITVVP